MQIFLFNPNDHQFLGNAIISQLAGEVHSNELQDDQVSLRSFEFDDFIDLDLELPIQGYLRKIW
jgi:hypothetical protein